MNKIETQHDIYLDQLRDLFSAESQIALTIGSLVEHSGSSRLKDLLRQNEQQSDEQQARIRRVFKRCRKKPDGDICQALLGLINGGNEHIARTGNPEVRDLLVVAHCLRMKHYKLAGYQFVVTLAARLGLEEDAAEFSASLEEERQAVLRLTRFAAELPMPRPHDKTPASRA